jgi:hypothetical protein
MALILCQLLAMVPKPVLAVVLLFPVTKDTERVRAEDEAADKPYPVDSTIMWIKQTVRFEIYYEMCFLIEHLFRSQMRVGPLDCEFLNTSTLGVVAEQTKSSGCMLLPTYDV